MDAKQVKAKIVPIIAPPFVKSPVSFTDPIWNLSAVLARNSDLASKFKIRISRASDVKVFGFIKKVWNS